MQDAEESDRPAYYVRAIERGLSVIRAFGATRPEQTLTQVAVGSGLDRATTRRVLLTLADLGYVRTSGKLFELTPKVLQLGYSYLSGLSLVDIARPHIRTLAETLGETASLTVLDNDDVVYLDLAASNRLASVRISVGTRFRAHTTSMGRVLLASQPTERVEEYFGRLESEDRTERLVRSTDELRRAISDAAIRGWAVVDEELEQGLRGIAAPVHNRRREVVAAVNVSVHSARHSLEDVASRYAPAIIAAAGAIEDDLYGLQD